MLGVLLQEASFSSHQPPLEPQQKQQLICRHLMDQWAFRDESTAVASELSTSPQTSTWQGKFFCHITHPHHHHPHHRCCMSQGRPPLLHPDEKICTGQHAISDLSTFGLCSFQSKKKKWRSCAIHSGAIFGY